MKTISFGRRAHRKDAKYLGPAIFQMWDDLRSKFGNVGAPELCLSVPNKKGGGLDYKNAQIGFKFKVPVYCRECDPAFFK